MQLHKIVDIICLQTEYIIFALPSLLLDIVVSGKI